MSISQKDICKAFFKVGQLEALVFMHSYKTPDPIETRSDFDEAIEYLVDFLGKVSAESKDKDSSDSENNSCFCCDGPLMQCDFGEYFLWHGVYNNSSYCYDCFTLSFLKDKK